MKNRFYLLLTALLLLLLSGCDDILNSVYPSYAPDETSSFGSNTIEVSIEIDSNVDVYSSSIRVSLVPMNDGELDLDSAYTVDYWGTYYINTSFNYLTDKAYRIFVYQDDDGSYSPGYTEVSTMLSDYSSYQPELFDFRYVEEDTYYYADGYLGNYSGIDYEWLESYNTESNDSYVDLGFDIQGTTFLNSTSFSSEYYYLDFYSSASDISIYWYLLDEYDSLLLSGQTSNSDSFNVDYTDIYSLDDYDNLQLEVEVNVTIGSVDYTLYQSLNVEISSADPGFSIYGNSYLYTEYDTESVYSYTIDPWSSSTIDTIQWRITDEYWNDVYYNGSSGFNYVDDGYTYFDIDYSLLDSKLNTSRWDDMDYLYIEVYVTYENGSDSWQTYYVQLDDEGSNSSYNIYGSIDLGYTYGYNYFDYIIYEVNTGDSVDIYSDQLSYDYNYFNYYGEYYLSLNIEENTGKEQWIYINIPDGYGGYFYYWGELWDGSTNLNDLTISDFTYVPS